MKKNFLVGTLVILLGACTAVNNDPLPQSIDDPAMKEVVANLSDTDKKILAQYLMRRELSNAFGNGGLNDGVQTVGEALAAQKAWAKDRTESEKQATELKAEVAAERAAVSEQISKAITVAFVDTEFVPSNYRARRYDEFQSLTFAVENKTAKKIKAVKGEAVFLDTFGDEYVRVPMQIEEAIDSKERKTIELSMEINKFLDEHKKIMNLDKDYEFRFNADHIVFEDGSEIEAPDPVS